MLDLQAIEQIKRLKYLYCYGIDTSDCDILTSVFSEDVSLDYVGGTYRFHVSGRENAVVALTAAFHPMLVGSHTVHHPIIDVHNNIAEGQWTLVDYAMDLSRSNLTTVGSAIYRDTYAKKDDVWKICRSTYNRIYERVYVEPDPSITAHFLSNKERPV